MSSTQIRVLIDAKGTISGLDTVNKGLKGVQDNAAKTNKAVSQAVQLNFTGKLEPLKDLQGLMGGVSTSALSLRNVLAGGIIGAAFIKGVSAAVDESVKLQNALIGVESVARSFGQDTNLVKAAVLDFTKDGLVPATEAALAFKQILSTGTDLPTAIKLMNSLKDVASFNRQSFYSLGEAIVATTEGIKNGNSVRADAVGVTKNLSVLEKEYAASIGTTVGKLTDQEKIQARVTGFIREAGFAQGDAAKLLDTYAGSVQGLSTAYSRMMATIGDFITQSSLVKSTVKGITAAFNAIEESLAGDSTEKRIKKIKSQLDGYLKDAKDSPYKQRLEDELRILESQVAVEKRLNDTITGRKTARIANKKAAEETAKVAAKAASDRQKEIEKLDKSLRTAGETELQTLKRIREERLKLVGPNDLARRTRIEQDFAKKVNELNQKNHDEQVRRANELAKLNKRLTEDAIKAGAANPFSRGQMPEGLTPDQQAKYNTNNTAGRVVGGLNFVAGGAEGAKGLVTAAASTALDAIVPGLGSAAKPLLDAFAEGPEATKKMVQEFARALPDVITGFVEAIPVFVETLIEEAPRMIEKLVERAPDIINKLVEKAPDIIIKLAQSVPKIITTLVANAPKIIFALASAMPKVAWTLMTELIKGVPMIVGSAATALYNAVVQIFNGMFGSGGGVSSFAEDANDWLGDNVGIKFAKGGEVPKGAGTPFRDSVPATLMPGERVLDLETNRKFKEFVDNGGNNKTVEMLLTRIVELLERPIEVKHETKLNQSALSYAILQLTRTNQRTS